MLEIREELRKAYADHPELYGLARERERTNPGLLRYRGNTDDLRQRSTLRVLLYDIDKLTYEKFCRRGGLPVPDPKSIFREQPDCVRVVRGLSTIEELELALALSRYALHLFDAPESLTKDQLASLMESSFMSELRWKAQLSCNQHLIRGREESVGGGAEIQ